jgi:hypothetical protein
MLFPPSVACDKTPYCTIGGRYDSNEPVCRQAAFVLDKVSEFIGVEALVPDENSGFAQKCQ